MYVLLPLISCLVVEGNLLAAVELAKRAPVAILLGELLKGDAGGVLAEGVVEAGEDGGGALLEAAAPEGGAELKVLLGVLSGDLILQLIGNKFAKDEEG